MTIAPQPFLRLATAVAVVIIMAAASRPPSSAHAQRVDESLPPLADLTITSENKSGFGVWVHWTVTVKNNTVGVHPGTHVHRVKVQITIADVIQSEEKVRSTQMWTIGGLPPGDSVKRIFESSRTIPAATDGPAKVPQRMYAEIVESDPVESPRFRFNNATEHWALVNRREGDSYFTNADPALALDRISDRFPRAGGATTFTVEAYNEPPRIPGLPLSADTDHTVFEFQVEISLTPGLSFTANQQAPSGTTFDTATGIWNIGSMGARRSYVALSLPVAVNLTADSLADLPLEERCVTAKVVRAVPWFASDPLKRANDTDTACLGAAVLLAQGETVLFDYIDCVGATSTPCTSADTLELVAELSDGDYEQPEVVIVHLQDPQGRYAGKWRTGRTTHHISGTPDTPGVGAIFSFVPSGWSAYNFMISDVSPKQRPGAFTILGGSRTTFTMLDADTKTSHPDTNLSSSLTSNPYPALLVFSTLGTYKIKLTVGATKSGTAYTASGAYTFHVGPIADLEPEAAWTLPGVFTVTARNNGPDIAPAARVRVNLPQGMRFLRAEAGEGGYDPVSGVWDIGYLYPAADPATLTVYTEPTGEAVTQPVTASIANHQDYCVRIKTGATDPINDLECTGSLPSGYTEHSAAYYDHLPGNNTASLAALSTAPASDATTRVTGMAITSSPDPSRGYYLSGQELEVEATFSDPVTAAAGARLRLHVGRSLREATVVPSTGEAIRFRYRLQWDDRTDPARGIRVPANPFAGTANLKPTGGRTLSLYFPNQDLGSGHRIGPQPDSVHDKDTGEYTNLPAWSDPWFLTTGQEGSRYRFIDGMRHYYVYDSLTQRWMLEFRIANDRLSAEDLDLIQWAYLRASGHYDPHQGHPYADDADPVEEKPYLGRWNDSDHHDNQVCWGLEADFGPGKTRGQRLAELADIELERFGRAAFFEYQVTQTESVSNLLTYTDIIASEACPDVPLSGLRASPPPGAAIVGMEMSSIGPYQSGDAIAVAVIFDREVEVSGSPRLAIEVGGEARAAVYDAARSGPRSKVFSYTALETDRDGDGVSVYPGSVTLPTGASIRDLRGIPARLDHDGLAAQTGHTVGPQTSQSVRTRTEGVAGPPPVVTGLAMRGSGPYGEGDTVSVAATFDWDVSVEGTPALIIELGETPRAAPYQPSLSEAAVKVFSYTVKKDDRDRDGVSVYPGTIALPPGASIRDDLGTDADLTIAGLPPQPGHTVDGSQKGASAEVEQQQEQASSSSEPQTVPADWPLIPEGIGPGDSFRLLFVTSSGTSATSTRIADYNAFAQAAAGNNAGLEPFSGEFRALISTSEVDARDNTETTGTGVPVHWLGGEKVADDYADLYDGEWDSAGGRTETGGAYTGLVWTGGNKAGGKSGQKYAGAAETRLGDLSDVTLPLSSPTSGAATEAHPLYALSPVISVAAEVQRQQQASNDEPQFALDSDSRRIDENAATGTNVGSPVTAADTDGDALTYALSGSDAFAIGSSSGQITVQGALDYETQNSYALTVSVSDGKNASGDADDSTDDTIAVTVSVGNLDEPGTVSLDADTPRSGSPLNASLSDPDGDVSGVTWAWQVSTDGTNWTDIATATARTYTPSDDDVGGYLRATAGYSDGHGSGKSASASTTGAVEAAPDTTAPTIASGPVIVSSPSVGDTYGKEEDIVVAVTFSEAVTVGGEPRIRLTIGERNRWARYVRSEANGTRLVFAYTVKGSDRDENGVSIEADQLRLNRGSIADANGNAAVLSSPALSDQSGHKVDGSPEEQPTEQQQPAEQQATSTVSVNSPTTVSADSPLVPAGIGPGDSFRLLFVTSATTTATSTDIADYNAFVQDRAATTTDLASFSEQFTALISTSEMDARDNTETTGEGVPIHWLGGEKVADDYADLYDGDWDSVAGMTEDGDDYTGLVWTGGNKAGEKSGQHHAGAAETRLGDLSDVTLPLSSPQSATSTESYPLYALSPVITVAEPE